MDIHHAVLSIQIILKVCTVFHYHYFLNSKALTAEKGFYEQITPSLTQDVEHVTLFTDLPPF